MGVAALRQDRPQMPVNWCPFDPGSGRVPEHYEVFLYPNDFPAFSFENPPYLATDRLVLHRREPKEPATSSSTRPITMSRRLS